MKTLSRRYLVYVFGASALAACHPAPSKGGGSAQGERIRAKRDDAAAALLPAGVRFVTEGVFTVGATPNALPLGDYADDGKTLIGIEPDISQLIADGLGRELRIIPTAWEDWPLGLASGRFDAVISNVTVTEERKKKFDFSTYREDVLGFYVASNSPTHAIHERRDIAGLKIIVAASTNQDQILRRWNAQNVAEGLKPAEPIYLEDVVIARQTLLSGRADATFGPNATAAYQARDGKIRLVGTVSGGWPQTSEIAVATRRGSGLAEAVTHVLNTQIANGNYAAVLRRWNLTAEAVTQSRTNPPGLPAA